MHWTVEIFLYGLLLVTAVAALQVRNLMAAVVVTTAYSFTSALLFVSMGAVDVGFTEAVVGAGVIGVLYIVALFQTTRGTSD
jgi:multicomponent Na+:H+ antiporter subunit B